MAGTRRTPPLDGDWQVDWEEQRRWQLTASLRATPTQRLAWLEEMLRLAHHSGALERKRARDLDERQGDGPAVKS